MSDILARHVLCVLGNWEDFDEVERVVERVGGEGFELDREYSMLESDDRMPQSFEVSRDRVDPSFSETDEAAVEQHLAVVYVLSPPIEGEAALEVSARALRLLGALLEAGGTAAKAESAGIAHGRARWLELAAASSSDALRSAFVRRPLHDEDDGVFYSCGMHLLGRRDLEVPDALHALASVELMDAAAAILLAHDGDADLEGFTFEHQTLGAWKLVDGGDCSRYEDDSFLFNPQGYWGIVPEGEA